MAIPEPNVVAEHNTGMLGMFDPPLSTSRGSAFTPLDIHQYRYRAIGLPPPLANADETQLGADFAYR
jgi:hypothetical protein